jgi:transcriptional regulator with XRE-family HTH domain
MRRSGLVLRRLRRLKGMKQTHAADILGVSQATFSRWERTGLPAPELLADALARLAGAPACADRALKRLVEESCLPMHLICDVSHVLFAASRPRTVDWRVAASSLIGSSLWRYASPEIQSAERRLPELGWDGMVGPAFVFRTGSNRDPNVPIPPALTLWERVRLEDGRDARLVTTVARAPAYARFLDMHD